MTIAYVLIDFGLSCHFERKENGLLNKQTNLMIKENLGTSIFRAPEVANQENYSEKVDIFSLGMTAMYLFDFEKMEREFKKNRKCNWSDLLDELIWKSPLMILQDK
ncbi:predicted protein [Naegleria gruberi]|uniref:Predicted protein n=1 Tax=Naegleria gruberi TaxID=5762 RepID=D2VFG6_NAEGR|nr:uncharacterized protein NAEGRDRAFT_67620 [Naegleria gruberi]EFC44361.1 predicted protein [Naegleria gruberi]|eukprot:XP_002677105.1 predicted protein [Naegleria gruberi strain NEG-M]